MLFHILDFEHSCAFKDIPNKIKHTVASLLMVAIDDEMGDNDDQWNSQSKEGGVNAWREAKSGLPARQGLFILMLPMFPDLSY